MSCKSRHSDFHCLMRFALISLSFLLLSSPIAMGGILSEDMVRNRSLEALKRFYQQNPARQVSCTSSKLGGKPAGFAIQCLVDREKHLWYAATLRGEVVTLAPLNEPALTAAPSEGSGIPPLNNPRHLRVVRLADHERRQALARVQDAF